MPIEDFVERLRWAREQAGYNKKELAARSGVTRQTITNWEGARPPEKALPWDEVNALGSALEPFTSTRDLLIRAGYEIRCPEIQRAEDQQLLEAFQLLSPDQQAAVLETTLQLARRRLASQAGAR